MEAVQRLASAVGEMADADCKSVAEKTAKSSSDSSGRGGQSKSDDDMNADIDPVVVDEDDLVE